MAWTEDQQAAIDSRGQTLLLSAAAGSGKTAVLVERIIRRLLDTEHPIDITELLVVTFTKAAAAEMRERVSAALTQVLSKTGDPAVERQLALLPSAHISTLHAFCQDVIRRYFYTIDLDPVFTIAGQEELNLLRRSIMENVFLSYYEDDQKASVLYPLADMFGSDRGDDVLMDTISRMYEYSRSMPWPRRWLEKAAAAYDVPREADLDDMPWCGPVKDQIRRSVENQIHMYRQVLAGMKKRPALAAAYEQFAVEAAALEQLYGCSAWGDMQKAALAVEFPRLKAVRKLSDADKEFWEICKKIRNDVKKEINETVQGVYFSASPQDWLEGIRAMHPVMTGLVCLTEDFAEAYRQAKKEKGWIDFSDLEHFCLQILLREDAQPGSADASPAAEELRSMYKEVLIDEYQDTNGVQELITQLISREDNRFMVGDMKQSIYRFRLADPNLFLQKYRTFSREIGAAQRCIDLSKNFRSAPGILAGVNEVFAAIMTEAAAGMVYGERERLYAGRTEPSDQDWIGGSIEIHLLDTGDRDVPDDTDGSDERELTAFEKECALVARRLQDMKASGKKVVRKDGKMEPVTYHHMVVLLRSMAGKADVMLQALQAAGIPAYAEQNGGYFAAIEVQIMMALLRCIDNPEQDLPMAAVLRSSLVGLDETALAALRLSGEGTLWQNLPLYMQTIPFGKARDCLENFCARLQNWRTFSRRNGVAELLQKLYADTAYYEYVGGMPNGTVRQANLQALYDRARQYEKSGFRGIFRYLKLIDKMKEDGLDLAPAKVISESEDVVRIMSIHKSKGLEFPVVVIADMGKRFNRQDMQAPVLFHNMLGIGLKQYDAFWRMLYPTFIWNGISAQLAWESTAEEERVLYVAMTRARDKLILTGHGSHLDVDWRRWQSGSNPAQARSYWDWVLPVVAGTAEGQQLADAVGSAQAVHCRCGLWELFASPGTAGPDDMTEALRDEPRLEKLRVGDLTGTAVPVWMEEALSWQYEYGQAVQTPAKFSVSEVKRQYGLLHADELLEEDQLAVQDVPGTGRSIGENDVFRQLPPWLEEEAEQVNGARRGTVTHKVMQYLPVRPDMTERRLRDYLAQWEGEGLFTEEETALVYVPAVLRFCCSPLGRQMARASTVYREYPFSVLLAGGGAYLPAVEKGEQILLQGVIDCLFCEGESWIIVDYKTDHLANEDAFRTRYSVQLDLYKRAVEQIRGIIVRDIYIYSFYLQQEIRIPY